MWKTVKLGEIAKAVGGNGFPKKYQGYKNKDIPFFKVSDMNTDGNEKFMLKSNNFVDVNDLKEMKAKLHPAGTIIFPKIGGAISTNKKRILTKDAAFDNNVMGVVPSNKILPEYLYKFFLNIDLYELSNKAALPSIKNGTVNDIDFVLPPLAEQERIIAKLDSAFAEIDEVINISENKIKNSLAIYENCVRKNFDVNIANSEIKKLSEISTYFNGLTYSPKDVSEEGTIVLRSSNIQNGRMHFDDIVRVKKDIKEKLIVLPNDILICSRNGSKRLIGKCSLIGIQEEPMTFGTFMMIVRSEFNYYLQWFFQSDFFKEQISQGQNTAINQITRYMLDEVKLPLPDISIQNKISKQLSEIDKNVRQVNKLQTQKIYELLKLKQAILKQELQPKEVA